MFIFKKYFYKIVIIFQKKIICSMYFYYLKKLKYLHVISQEYLTL